MNEKEQNHDQDVEGGGDLLHTTTATTTNNNEKKVTKTFRSILPHEPLPTFDDNNNDDDDDNDGVDRKGYIHLQGAFEPKPRHLAATPELVSTTTTTKVDDPTSFSNNNDNDNNNYYWTAETLQRALLSSLQKNVIDHTHNSSDGDDQSQQRRRQRRRRPPTSSSSSSFFYLPYPVESVEIVDPNNPPPYTKVRLKYGTPQQAQYVLAAWRGQKISPHHLLFDHCQQSLQQQHYDAVSNNSNDFGGTSSSSSSPSSSSLALTSRALNESVQSVFSFGSHPCQVTMVTPIVKPSIPNNNDDDDDDTDTTPLLSTYWSRSNPPKLRRLLHDRDDAIERSQTRFVYVNGLQLNTNILLLKDIDNNVDDDDDDDEEDDIIDSSSLFWYDTIIIQRAIRNVFGQDVEIFLPRNHPKDKKKRRRQQQQQQQNHQQEEQDGNKTNNNGNDSGTMIESCHLGFRTPQDAQRIVQQYQGVVVKWELMLDDNGPTSIGGEEVVHSNSGPLFLDFVTVTNRSHVKAVAAAASRGKGRNEAGEGEGGQAVTRVVGKGMPSRPDCTSTTDHVHIPGLVLVQDYLTIDEENVLMAVLTGPYAPWAPDQINKSQTGTVKRKVQHYGYVFDYKTADVLRDREDYSGGANCPPLPGTVWMDDRGNEISSSTNSMVDDWIQEGRGWDVLAALIERTRQYEFETLPSEKDDDAKNDGTDDDDDDAKRKTKNYPYLNQLTVNQYKPGEGIGSHIDTPSAFGDGLISISLNGGIVMEFQKKKDNTTDKEDENDGHNNINNSRKLVYLPPRSLLLMSGPARYEWEHQIVTRRTDTVDGIVLPRALRISLTLRTALDLDGRPMPRVESNIFPPVWTTTTKIQQEVNQQDGPHQRQPPPPQQERPIRTNALATPDTERDHVHAVYDAIATQWHHTRGKRGVLWPGATQFLQSLPLGSVVADVGCGDGKYFPAIWEAGSFVIGTDISLPLLETSFIRSSSSSSTSTTTAPKVADTRKVSPHRQSFQERPAVAVADCMSVPIRTSSCDAAICIAVMHHLSTVERRIRCIEELVRIVKPGGLINVQAWAIEQTDDSRRKFVTPDVFVPFNAQPKYLDRVDRGRETSTSNSVLGRGGISTAPLNNKDSFETSALPTESMTSERGVSTSKSVAELYSEAYTNADFDERKGLVIFQRYCHLYRQGEMEEIASLVPNAKLVESGYESGNHFLILQVTD